MPKEPIHKKIDGHFYACTACDYEGGFHVTFRNTETPKVLEIILMCPNCEQTYDINWKIETA
jgi:hypothetical protein